MIRIVKIGSVKEISALKHRATPIAILQRMGLIDQALPLSNFYLKVRLLPGVTDEVFCNKVRACNRAIGDRLFHSVYTGMETLSLDPNQRPKKTPTMPDHNTDSYMVVDGLPFYITLKDVRDWLTRVSQTPNAKVDWGEGPKGTCVVVTASSPSTTHCPP